MSAEFLDLTTSFDVVKNPTPFGIYDNDASFVTASNNQVQYTFHKLGGSQLQVEISNKDVYASLEESVLEYSSVVNQYHAKSVLADIIGSQTGSLTGKENKLPQMSLELQKRLGSAYGSEALVGGQRTLHSASIDLSSSKQNYDLDVILSQSGITTGDQRVEIREMFHFSPTAAYRFFDTTSAVNYLHNQFNFESFTPETIFYLLPIWEDVLRAQQLEMSHKIRRSNYSYSIVNNVLKLYPVPTSNIKLHFTYYLTPNDPYDDTDDPLINGVSNLSNVPFDNISYSKINSLGKQWIRRFALSLSKEILGQVRGKVSDIPIPNGSLVLNGADLISQAKEEQNALREELKAMFEETSYQKLMQQEMESAQALQEQFRHVPLGIYVGM